MKNFDDIFPYFDRLMKFISNRWLDDLLKNRDNIIQALDTLSDDESRDVLLKEMVFWILNYFMEPVLARYYYGLMTPADWDNYVKETVRLNIHPEIVWPQNDTWVKNYCLTTTFILEQYRYKDKVFIENGDICLDIGACCGDSSIWMLSNGAKCTYAFEIDKTNIACMQETFKKRSEYGNIHIINKACGISDGILYYNPDKTNIGGGHTYSAKPKNFDGYEVKSVTIDSFCEQNNLVPNFIKMDIEGAEIDAIKGAVQTFRKHRPKFAICVYHAWSHRWQIPILINSIVSDYEFYLKKSNTKFETVLLGRPKIK